jgi:hypothetical protein
VTGVENIDLLKASLAHSAHLVTDDGSARTYYLDPESLQTSGKTYHLYVDAADYIDLKGYGAERVEIRTGRRRGVLSRPGRPGRAGRLTVVRLWPEI